MEFNSKTIVVPYEKDIYGIAQFMVRCFLILGTNSALLLDTGAMDEDLPELVSGVTSLPVTLCLTHSDGDHTAALYRFKSAYAHTEEIPLLKSRNPGLETELLPVEEGHIFDLGGRQLEVIHNPGHTPGSISLLDRENRILFSGDTLSHGPVFMFGEHRDLTDYTASLEKLAQLSKHFDTIYPCHNTCPLNLTVIDELRHCVSGISDGSIAGHKPAGMLPPGAEPLEYNVGSSGIYY